MSKKPVEVPTIGFNEALKRIAKFDKEKLPDNLKQDAKEKPVKQNASRAKRQTTLMAMFASALVQIQVY